MTWTPAVHLRSRHGARGRDNARTHLLGKEARSGLHNAYEGIGSNDGHRDLATGVESTDVVYELIWFGVVSQTGAVTA